MSYPTTGYTPTISERTRLENEFHTCMKNRRATPPNKYGEVGGFEYWGVRARSAYRQLRALSAPAADTGDNADRIAALQAELTECNNMRRILEIQEELKRYGVEVVDENEAADKAQVDTGKIGEPLTHRQANAVRKQHAEFRAGGGAYSLEIPENDPDEDDDLRQILFGL